MTGRSGLGGEPGCRLTPEGKYLQTDSAEVVGGRSRLEGLALLVGAGIRF